MLFLEKKRMKVTRPDGSSVSTLIIPHKESNTLTIKNNNIKHIKYKTPTPWPLLSAISLVKTRKIITVKIIIRKILAKMLFKLVCKVTMVFEIKDRKNIKFNATNHTFRFFAIHLM